ncbi:MAG: hypothetical protein M1821_007467 [Bathelium mastoideum]|nr:MAG: hypothetical protein M1821_007467 [Bathelium mastoideum]
MPPSNTPEASSSSSPTLRHVAVRPQTPPSYLSALHELESPVLDLASTLTMTAAEDEADAENVQFLRRLMDPDWSPQDLEADEDMEDEDDALPQLEDAEPSDRDRILPVPVPEQYRTLANSSTQQGQPGADALGQSSTGRIDGSRRRSGPTRFSAEREFLERALSSRQRNQRSDQGMPEDEVERVVRLQDILSRLNRLQEPPYGARIPSQQSLYDWAPANDEDDGEELEDILRELRQQQPNTHPEILRVLGRSQLDAEREARSRAYSSRFLNSHSAPHPQSSESSLRSAAILQSVRRHPRFAARSRDYLQRYVMDRERAGNDGEDRERLSSRWIRPSSMETTRYEMNRLAWQTQQRLHEFHPRDGQTRSGSLRRNHPDSPSQNTSSSSPYLESAIKYLSRLRDSTCYEQSLFHAIEGGLVTKGFFGDQRDDFILDPESLLPPPPSSWLAPGMVFEGSQHATATAAITSTSYPSQAFSGHSASSTATYRLLNNNQSIASTTFDPAISRPNGGNFDPSRPWLSYTPTPPTPLGESAQTANTAIVQDNWPVRVTIHAVDYKKMTLSGTMEAFNVPSHPPTYTTLSSSHPTGQTPALYTPGPLSYLSHTAAGSTSPLSPPSPGTPTASPIPPTGKPITTYLDGEILDFAHHHTLLTTAFQASPATDACYWRKLPPFAPHTTPTTTAPSANATCNPNSGAGGSGGSVGNTGGSGDEGLVRRLLSKSGYEELRRDWILMRWKERGFVRTVSRDAWGRYVRGGGGGAESPASASSSLSPSLQAAAVANGGGDAMEEEVDAEKWAAGAGAAAAAGAGDGAMQGHGLTISGFYYVCLRRRDGKVEGLYYDPQSSPYQHLRLSPVRAPGMGLAASGLR